MRFIQSILLTCLWLLCRPEAAYAQEPVTALTDWNVMQIDPSDLARLRPLLQGLQQGMRSTLFPGMNQPLLRHASLSGKPLSSNMARALQNFYTLESAPTLTSAAIPSVCKLGEFIVFAIEEGEIGSGKLTKAYHWALPYTKLLPPNSTAPANANTAATIIDGLKEQQGQADTFPPHATKLGLNLKIDRFPVKQGSPHCATMLLSHNLAQKAAVMRIYGEQQLQLLRHSQSNLPPLSRHNRMLQMTWIWEKQDASMIALALNFRATEEVFSQRLPEQGHAEVTFTLAEQKITASPVKAIEETITVYESELSPSNLPQIVAINRAWVYLDRGRAWGLKMGDRLLAQGSKGWIKGHVVGYYGPGLNLKDPSGKLVSEGAIVYIRKGQRDTKKGLTFKFDTTTYPTPWPPVAQPQTPPP